MIKEFREQYGFTQKQFSRKMGIALRTLRRYEAYERQGKEIKTDKYLKMKSAMMKYGVDRMKTKVYENNAKLIEQANREYSPENIMIESVLKEEPKPINWKWIVFVLIVLIVTFLW